MLCEYCLKEIDEKYIIDSKGNQFCSEHCLEEYLEEGEYSFDPHPYEDTYLLIRSSYIHLLESWERSLQQVTEDLEDAVDELLEEIDELIDDHADFIFTEGDDGPYAWEIYQYTIKLRGLQNQIFAWRPQRKTYYWVTGSNHYGNLDAEEEKRYENMCADLYLNGYEEFLAFLIDQHQHPYHWGVNYIFERRDMAEEALKILLPFCSKHGVEVSLIEAHKCEAHCGDILETDADTYVNGWFYCYSCKESDEHGIFTLQELEMELEYYDNHEEERQMIIYEREDWCAPFKRKIKRTCRALNYEIPLWAD